MKNLKLSLGNKLIALLIVYAVLLSTIAVFINRIIMTSLSDQQYQEKAAEISGAMPSSLDHDKISKLKADVYAIYDKDKASAEPGSADYVSYQAAIQKVFETDEYQQLLKQMQIFEHTNQSYRLYIADIDAENDLLICLVDGDPNDPLLPGEIEPFSSKEKENAYAQGIPAYITQDENRGYLSRAAAVISGDNGETIAYAFVEVSLDEIYASERASMFILTSGIFGLTGLACLLAIYYIQKSVVDPINKLSGTALKFRQNGQNGEASFRDIEINTGDEIESLYHSMVKMEGDIERYVDKLVETRTKLHDAQREVDEMNELAHKDALTGIRNKMAYDSELKKLEAELDNGQDKFGIVMIDLNDLKTVNDTYGHDCGNASLQIISGIICQVFRHSPVFRIGGDEFAVVLRNHDYDNIEQLVRYFPLMIDVQSESTDKEWEKVRAAIGYALYDADIDHSVDDVFRRADQQMYENKESQKHKES